MPEGGRKRVAAVLAIDLAGYSSRAETDAGAAASAVAELHARVHAAAGSHDGRVFSTAGDGLMCEFAAASEAVAAAFDILAAAPAGAPPARIGVHLGEVYEQDSGDLLGHGVNVAARLEQLAAPGTALVSRAAADVVQGDLRDRLVRQGHVALDKMNESIEAFVLDPAAKGGRVRRPRRKRALLIVGAVAATAAAVAGLAVLWSAGIIGPSHEQRMQAALDTPEARAAVTRALIEQLSASGAVSDATLSAISAMGDSTALADQNAFDFLRRGETENAVRALETFGVQLQQEGRPQEAALVFTRASGLALLLTPERSLALARRGYGADRASIATFDRYVTAMRLVEGHDSALEFSLQIAESGEGPVAVYARLIASNILTLLERHDEAWREIERAGAAVARYQDNARVQFVDRQARALHYIWTLDFPAAQQAVSQAREIARQIPGEEWRGDLQEVQLAMTLGDSEGAWRASTRAIAERQARGWPASHTLLLHACAARVSSELEGAAPYCRAAGRTSANPLTAVLARLYLAIEERRLDDARREVEVYRQALAPENWPADLAGAASALSQIAILDGDYAAADRHFADARAHLESAGGDASLYASAYHVQGFTEARAGRLAEGCAKLARAASYYQEYNAAPGAAEAQADMRRFNCPV